MKELELSNQEKVAFIEQLKNEIEDDTTKLYKAITVTFVALISFSIIYFLLTPGNDAYIRLFYSLALLSGTIITAYFARAVQSHLIMNMIERLGAKSYSKDTQDFIQSERLVRESFSYAPLLETIQIPLNKMGVIPFSMNNYIGEKISFTLEQSNPIAIIAAQSGAGKSVLARKLAEQHLKNSGNVLMLSTEKELYIRNNRAESIQKLYELETEYPDQFSYANPPADNQDETISNYLNKMLRSLPDKKLQGLLVIVDEFFCEFKDKAEQELIESLVNKGVRFIEVNQLLTDEESIFPTEVRKGIKTVLIGRIPEYLQYEHKINELRGCFINVNKEGDFATTFLLVDTSTGTGKTIFLDATE